MDSKERIYAIGNEERKMTKTEIIKALRDMAKYPTVTLPRDCEALRAAADLLAQPAPVQEPVAWLSRRYVDNFPVSGYETAQPTDYGAFPVYTTPPAAPVQEPVAWRFKERPDDLRSAWRYVSKKQHIPHGWPYQSIGITGETK
jgi:hypothetical protein